ncbi:MULTISPECIES: DUF5908 family protein [Aquimarina]|uniref:DUF5908 family protein n=1 Tax=Aquimarina TaxID=290174 RepID=UPI000B25BA38|nr:MULTISPECIES: DUF5908 family protein [Aquimarina]
MPIEIRELIIKTTVNNTTSTTGSANNAAGGGIEESQINEIADKIFEIIKEKSER